MRECLVEERLSVGEREPLSMAQELFPRDGVKSGTQAGLILFGESHRAGVEAGRAVRTFDRYQEMMYSLPVGVHGPRVANV